MFPLVSLRRKLIELHYQLTDKLIYVRIAEDQVDIQPLMTL